MPISAANAALYPPDWDAIALRVKVEQGWRCAGSPAYPDCRAAHGEEHPVTGSKVVLTVAHRDHNPSNYVRQNLVAWCQRCHVTYDADHHARNAATTRARRLREAGQQWLFAHCDADAR